MNLNVGPIHVAEGDAEELDLFGRNPDMMQACPLLCFDFRATIASHLDKLQHHKMASTTIILPADYGYCILVALGAVPLLAFGQGIVVGSKRKQAKVPYPNYEASQQQVKESRQAYEFNAAQRAHAHLLENMSQTVATILVAGLVYPRASAALGAGWLVSRILFCYGYVTSTKPHGNGRYLGGTFWLFQAGLWGLSCAVGFKLLNGGLL